VPYALEAVLLSDALACTPPPSQQTAAAVPFFTALGPANEIHDASGLSMGGRPGGYLVEGRRPVRKHHRKLGTPRFDPA